jgi:hypothetical protein
MGVEMMALGAVTSMMAAKQQNKAVARSMYTNKKYAEMRRESIIERRGIMQKQTLAARDAETLKTMRRASEVRGKIRVAQAAGGLSTGSGSGARIVKQADIDEAQNLGILNTNTANRMQMMNLDYKNMNLENMANYENNINQALSQGQNTMLAGLTGGISGLSTGLGIQRSVQGGSGPMSWSGLVDTT